jgi:hypothetical protein
VAGAAIGVEEILLPRAKMKKSSGAKKRSTRKSRNARPRQIKRISAQTRHEKSEARRPQRVA